MKAKKYISIALSLVMVLYMIVPVSAADVGIIINGQSVQFTADSGAPFVDSANRTQVPLRVTMESYGCEVDWDNSTRTAIVEKDGTKVEVPIGQKHIFVNGNKIVNDTAATLKDGRTYLPIRAVLEAFGGYVTWNSASNSVEVDSTSQLMKVHFIDVGQADAIFIDVGDEEILIDAGNNGDGEKIVEYIKPFVDGNLNLFIATHPDADHIGGAEAIFDNFKIMYVVDSGMVASSQTFKDYENALKAENCNYKEDRDCWFEFDNNIKLKVIETGDGYADVNDCSVVVELEYNQTKVLFTGDMSSIAESDNISKFSDIDVLKVAHHGSKSSTSEKFLSKVKPEYAVISASKNNSYNHPNSETLQRLFDKGTKVLGTCKSGTVVLSTNGRAYSFNKSNYLTLEDAGNQAEQPPIPITSTYIGNKNSKVFHESTCASVKRMNDSNKISFDSRTSAVNAGYTPCNNCNP